MNFRHVSASVMKRPRMPDCAVQGVQGQDFWAGIARRYQIIRGLSTGLDSTAIGFARRWPAQCKSQEIWLAESHVSVAKVRDPMSSLPILKPRQRTPATSLQRTRIPLSSASNRPRRNSIPHRSHHRGKAFVQRSSPVSCSIVFTMYSHFSQKVHTGSSSQSKGSPIVFRNNHTTFRRNLCADHVQVGNGSTLDSKVLSRFTLPKTDGTPVLPSSYLMWPPMTFTSRLLSARLWRTWLKPG